MGRDGWEPLARFLGRPVPKIPFPHVNDAAGMRTMLEREYVRKLKLAVLVIARLLLPLWTLLLGYHIASLDLFASVR